MTEAFAILIAEPGPARTAGWMAVWLLLSLLVGWPLRRGWAERAAFGLLMLGGSADLALFTLRALNASTQWMGPLALAYAGLQSLTLSRLVLNRPAPAVRWHPASVLMLAVVMAAAWAVRIIQVEPSSGLSSHLGWVPQYVLASFRAGRFVQPGELAAGSGLMEAISYVADALGLTALAAWTGTETIYPAYHATSILAAALALVVVARRFAAQPVILAAFLVVCGALAGTDPLFRTVLLRHWGDTFILLGGALMLTSLARDDAEDAWKAAAAAAAFLVFSRHYAVIYGALVLVLGWALVAVKGRRSWWPWVALGVLLCANASREVWCVLFPPSPWYPGTKLVADLPSGLAYWVQATLNDIGILTDNEFSPAVALTRMLYLPAAGVLVVLARRRGWGIARPLVVLALPYVLEAATGYRTPSTMNKLLILIVLLAPFLPAWALAQSDWSPRLPALSPRLLRWGVPATIAALALALIPAGPLLQQARELYRSKNADYQIAAALHAQLGDRLAAEAARPVLYVSFEPGMGLRNFIGGDVVHDLDWQGETVLSRVSDAADLGDLVARLGYPNIYVALYRIYPGFDRPGRDRLEAELYQPLAGKPWVEAEIATAGARFIIPRRP